jgi:O-antigen biosynthesis protein
LPFQPSAESHEKNPVYLVNPVRKRFSKFCQKPQAMRNFIDTLRESKLELKERLKMQRFYGTSQGPVATFKTVCSGFPFSKNSWRLEQEQELYQDDIISETLNAQEKRIRELCKNNKRIFDNPPEVTFVSYSIPRLNSTSSSFRLCQILKILLENHCKINFLYCMESWNDSKLIKTFKGDIDFTHLTLNLEDYDRFVADKAPQYVWITELWRMNYVKFITKLVRELKSSRPSSKIIVDTVDFHYKEFQRKYELTEDPEDLKRADEFLKNEKLLYREADCVVVISQEEKKDIQDKIPNIKKIEVVPNVHKIPYNVRPYSRRKNICFVGHFGNRHNVDAVTYFIENIFHLILEKNPGVEFHVLGYSADRYTKLFESANVRVIGGLKYLEEALTYYRLFVCPMTYGAGMKGKIGGAIAAGIPVVTSSIGAEGFPFRDGEECYITDVPSEFAERCNQCLEDCITWYNLSIKSRLVMAENFSPSSVSHKLKKVLSN